MSSKTANQVKYVAPTENLLTSSRSLTVPVQRVPVTPLVWNLRVQTVKDTVTIQIYYFYDSLVAFL
mgnify:CR=1 FL=1